MESLLVKAERTCFSTSVRPAYEKIFPRKTPTVSSRSSRYSGTMPATSRYGTLKSTVTPPAVVVQREPARDWRCHELSITGPQ
jgi:hypothetical protein